MPRERIGAKKNVSSESRLDSIIQGIKAILNREQSNLVYNDLFQAVDNVVSSGHEQDLTKALTDLVTQRFSLWLADLEKQTGNPLISLFSALYDNLKAYESYIPKICLQYDKKVQEKLTSLNIIRDTFFKIIYTNTKQMDATCTDLIKNIVAIRKRAETDLSIARNLISMMYSFRSYPDDRFEQFIDNLLGETEEFYDEKYQTLYVGNMQNYLITAQDILEHELYIVSNIITESGKVEEKLSLEAHNILLCAFNNMFFLHEDVFFDVSNGKEPPISQALVSQDLNPLKWLLKNYGTFSQDTKNLVGICASFVQTEMLKFTNLFEEEKPKKEAGEKPKKAVAKKGTAKKAPAAAAAAPEEKEAEEEKETKGPAKPGAAKKGPAKAGAAKKGPAKGPAKAKAGAAKAAASKEEGGADKKKAAVSSKPDMIKNIEDLMRLALQLQKAFTSVFSDIPDAISALDKNIDSAWNAQEFNISHNFCIYIDYHIKNEFKYYNPEGLGPFEEVCGKFVRRMQDKKPFQITYESYFVRRLIKMGDKLKTIEYPTVQAIRRSINDFVKFFDHYMERVKESQDILEAFRMEMQQKGTDPNSQFNKISFSPIILDSARFTLQKVEVKMVPAFISEINTLFTASYSNGRPNKTLTLLSDLSQVEFRWSVPPNKFCKQPRNYTIICDVLCATILNEVATNKKISLSGLFANINESQDHIKGYIKRLCSGDTKVLKRKKSSTDGKLNDTDEFELNPAFFFKMLRVPIAPPDYNREKVKTDITRSSDTIIKAAAIRVLKQRNIIAQTDLENEITANVSQFFRPNITHIRRIIDSIQVSVNDEEVYCERDPRTGNLKYVK